MQGIAVSVAEWCRQLMTDPGQNKHRVGTRG
jgi:hypothetical protein